MKKINMLTLTEVKKIFEAFSRKRENIEGDFALAVADSHGELVFFVKTDNSSVSAGPIAINKAFTAARDRQKSSSLAAASSQYGFPVSSLGDLRYTGLGGGVPIIVDGQCIGAVAVSGLSQEDDEALAEEVVGLIIS